MGAQRILQAAGVALLLSTVAQAAPSARGERIAVVDLGPDDGAAQTVRAQIVAAGFEAVIGAGIEDALAGKNVDKDTVELAVAITEAQRAFGALDCKATIAASDKAIAIGAMRQAAGLAVPELSRALTYVLLCKDKLGDVDGAMTAAARLRSAGGSNDVPAPLWKKYPDVDAILEDTVTLEIETDVKGAMVYVDLQPRGKAPLKLQLRAGEHLIAVAAGTRRGWGAGHTDPKQAKVTIPTTDYAGTGSTIAVRVAGWKGAKPAPSEVAWVLNETRARLVLIRSGETLEAWGRVGRSETPHLLGGEDGVAKTTDKQDVTRLLALVTDRVQGWNERAPDPDQPLLLEKPGEGRFAKKEDEPAKWWVYAALAGAVAGVAAILYVNEGGEDRQRVELRFP
jgi:PEGA domain